ncbi:MAG: PKD domain-containing protein [Thermoflexales bacterium]|nr:PKD domain-containing protein [Thermoflexales bacterium]
MEPKESAPRGQGLVEFALVLPIILFLSLGIIDFARIIFIFNEVSNAAREAVRHGAVYPSDCAGIENKATNLILVPRADVIAVVTFDDGATQQAVCPGYPDPVMSGYRVKVTVEAAITPLTPVINNFITSVPIRYTASRTILLTGAVPPPPPPPPPATVTPTPGPPVAVPVCTPVSGGVPLQVTCTDNSTGGPTSWSWDFGDGTSSTDQNPPVHTYSNAGSYTVQLTVLGPGGSDTASVTIVVSPGPVAAFTCSPSSGNRPLDVICTDNSTGSVTDWTWDFGDGGSSTDRNPPAHTYSNAGSFVVQLTVTGPGGSSTANQTITVYEPAGVSALNCSPSSGQAPLAVNCTAATSGDIAVYIWEWGDGSSDYGYPPPTHIYYAAGDFTVRLTVQGHGGGSASAQTTIAVTAPPVDALFDCTPTSGAVPLSVSCTDASIGEPSSWSWDFGDGGTSSQQNPSHTYNAPGTYNVSLTASGPNGSDTELKTGYIVVASGVAEFSCTPVAGVNPLTISCTDASTGSPTAWSWNFGDGWASSLQNPTHLYLYGGIYTVTLTASGSGWSDTNTKTSYISVVDLYFATYEVCASANNKANIYVRATLTNTLKLPMTSIVVRDTTAGVELDPYSNYRFCKLVETGTGDKGDTHLTTASAVIGGATVVISATQSAVTSCPATTCP